MKPALSTVFLSTASGAGYGLLALLGLGRMVHDWGFGLAGLLLCLILIGMGLKPSRRIQVVQSDGHLVRQVAATPRRGITPTLTYLAMAAYGIYWIFLDPLPPAWLGWLTTGLAVVTVLWTASLGVQQGAARGARALYVAADHLLFAWMSGSLFYLMLAGFFRDDVEWALWNCIASILAAWAVTLIHWRVRDLQGRGRAGDTLTDPATPDGVAEVETPEDDTGDPARRIGYELARRHAHRLRAIAVSCAGVVPLVLCALALWADAYTLTGLLAGLAALITYPGVLVERWLLFSEAEPRVTASYERTQA